MRVLFVSQRRAERMRPPARAALISITDRGRPEATLQPGWCAVLRLAFDDADPVRFPGTATQLDPFDEARAAELARYIAAQLEQCARFVVHCRHGISRSGAVAKAIAEVTGAPFPAGYAEYNQHVFRLLRHALAQAMREA